MALGKHNVRVRVLAGKIAASLGNAIVAPVIAYVPEGAISPPTAHMRFPGTITISDQTFEQVLESASRSFKLHGFTDIVLIGDHGGYQSDFAVVASKLNKEWAKTGVRVHALGQYYQSAQSGFSKILLEHGIKSGEIGTHAGLADTSLLMAVAPGMVRADRLQAAGQLGSADGVYGGDPRRSSAELGQLGVDLIVRQSVQAIQKATARP
jgi:creatinine amidohydrolase/Fe(II)-dependent formamide hydrolase-like protein